MPQVSKAGYGTTSNYVATTATYTVGTNTSEITYLPITSGIATGNVATATISISSTDGSNGGINISSIVGAGTTTEPTNGYYLAV